ncbi:MAG TPA: group 1 truncated hemoglobin [Myxococcota bacterium]|nr:group 1 truncated hemoglobin [Myxococcota bacterium]
MWTLGGFEVRHPPVEPRPGSDLERLGEERVRRLVHTFMERVFADPMIGFYFQGRSLMRIRELECRFALAHLGGGDVYTGRPLDEAHGPLKIFGGHFDRRSALLRETLLEDRVDGDIVQRWLDHTERQRALVIGGNCR